MTTDSRASGVNRSNTALPPPSQEQPGDVLLVHGLLAHPRLRADVLRRPPQAAGAFRLERLGLIQEPPKGGHGSESHLGVAAGGLPGQLGSGAHGRQYMLTLADLSTPVDGLPTAPSRTRPRPSTVRTSSPPRRSRPPGGTPGLRGGGWMPGWAGPRRPAPDGCLRPERRRATLPAARSPLLAPGRREPRTHWFPRLSRIPAWAGTGCWWRSPRPARPG